MAKPVKPVLKGKQKGPEERGGKEEQKKLWLEQPKVPDEKPTEFNWGGFLVPNPEKLLTFLLVLGFTAVFYAFFVSSRGVSMENVPSIVIDTRTNLPVMASFLIIASYFWVCYAVERKLGFVRSVLPILLPELLIVIFLMMKIQRAVPPG